MKEVNEASQPDRSMDSAPRHRARELVNNAAENLLLVILVGIFLWRGFLPAWKSLNTDFPNYYLAARLYQQGLPLEQVYDWTWIQRQKDHAGIERPIVTFALLTPFSLLPASPFSSLPPLEAKRDWLLTNLLLLALAVYLLCRMSKLNPRRVAILVFLAIVPLRTNFLFGQEYVLLLFLFTLAAWLYFSNRPLESGLILAVGGALKIYPSLFLIFFARKKQWRAATGLVAGSIALWLLSASLFGPQTIRTYLVEVLPWPLRGEGLDPYNIGWNSLSAVLHRLFILEPELNPHPVAHLPALYAVLFPVCQAMIFVPFLWIMGSSRASVEREKLQWGAFVAMLLILSTAPASYDFVGLIVTAVFAANYLIGVGRKREVAAVIIWYALVCFPLPQLVRGSPSGWQTLLAVPRLWAMTGLWICLLVVLLRSEPESLRQRLKSREATAFAAIWLALVLPAVILNLIHLRGQFENYATRLVVAPEAYLETDPVIADGKVLFTMMKGDGFHTGMIDGGSLILLPYPPDSFHPATAPASATGWVELASASSRVVRFALNATAPGLGKPVVEVDEAEKPAVSMKGRWLAFIRESKGRGVLWVKELRPRAVEAGSHSLERELSDSEFDVLEAGFDRTDEIIFSARRNGGQPALFRTGPERANIVPEGAPAPRRYPAVSPDGRWLAFSQREGSNWQLWVRDLTSHFERRLIDSDCNSITPAWYPDSKHLVYATDCGRGYGLTALCRIEAAP
jgi:hypothetical protein